MAPAPTSHQALAPKAGLLNFPCLGPLATFRAPDLGGPGEGAHLAGMAPIRSALPRRSMVLKPPVEKGFGELLAGFPGAAANRGRGNLRLDGHGLFACPDVS